MLDYLVKLYLLIHGTIELPSHGAASYGAVKWYTIWSLHTRFVSCQILVAIVGESNMMLVSFGEICGHCQ